MVVLYTSSIETDVNYIEEVQETIIDGISSFFAEHIVIPNYDSFQTYDVATFRYYIVQWKSMPYILAEPYVFCEYNPSKKQILNGHMFAKLSFLIKWVKTLFGIMIRLQQYPLWLK